MTVRTYPLETGGYIRIRDDGETVGEWRIIGGSMGALERSLNDTGDMDDDTGGVWMRVFESS